MLLTVMALLSGCSLKTETVFIEPKKVTFVVPDVNITTVPLFKPNDINISKDKLHIETSVNTFLKIMEVSKKLRLENAIWKESFLTLKRQIFNYRKRVKDAK